MRTRAAGSRAGLPAGARRDAALADAAGARQTARGAIAGCAGAAPARSGTGEKPGSPAYAHTRHVPVRQLRISGAPVLLALPGMRRMGNVLAAACRRKRVGGMNDPRVIVALDFAVADAALALAARL